MPVAAAVAAPIRHRHPTPLDLLRDLGHWLAANSTGARLLAACRDLEALPDPARARHGLHRGEIARRVFAFRQEG